MTEFLVVAGVQVALLVLAWKVYFWSRGLANARQLAWRRRVGLIFFLAPLLLWLGELLLPEWLLWPLKILVIVRGYLDAALGGLTGAAGEHLPWILAVAVTPLCYAIVYGVAGILVGWPLDKLRGSGDEEEGEGDVAAV